MEQHMTVYEEIAKERSKIEAKYGQIDGEDTKGDRLSVLLSLLASAFASYGKPPYRRLMIKFAAWVVAMIEDADKTKG